jgi:hypothetical protein
MGTVDIAAVKARIDIVELLGRLAPHARVKVHGTRATSGCPAPHHAQTGHSPPVSIDIGKQLWRCHGCGAAGDVITALEVNGSLTRRDAIETAAYLASVPVEHWTLPAAAPRLELPARAPVVEDLGEAEAAAALAMVAEQRCWNVDTLERLGVRVVALNGRPRLAVPGPGATQYRALHVDGPRWLTVGSFTGPFGAPTSNTRVRGACDDVVLVVEGATDWVTAEVLADAYAPWPATFAAPGSNGWRDGWAEQLPDGATVVVAGDPDPAGDAYAARVVEDCSRHGRRAVAVRLDEQRDLSDLVQAGGMFPMADVADSVMLKIDAALAAAEEAP